MILTEFGRGVVVSYPRRASISVLLVGLVSLGWPYSFARTDDRLSCRFTAGYDISGFPKQIAHDLNIWVSPYVDVKSGRGGAEIRGDGRNVRIASYWRFEEDAIIAVRNRLFRVTSMRPRRGAQREEIDFESIDDKALLELISPNADTLFLPLHGHVSTGHCHADVSIARASSTNDARAIVKFFPQSADSLPKIAPRLTNAQMTQEIGAGDVLRYGNRGLKVRRVTAPDADRKITGWIELFDKELTFDE